MSTPQAIAAILKHDESVIQWREKRPTFETSRQTRPLKLKKGHAVPPRPEQGQYGHAPKSKHSKTRWIWNKDGKADFDRACKWYDYMQYRLQRREGKIFLALQNAYDAVNPQEEPPHTVADIAEIVERATSENWRQKLSSWGAMTDSQLQTRKKTDYEKACSMVLAFARFDSSVAEFHLDDEPTNGLARILIWCNGITFDANTPSLNGEPTQAEVDALLLKLNINGEEYQPHDYPQFVQHHVLSGNLRTALSNGQISAAGKCRENEKNRYLVRSVVTRFWPNFNS